MLSGQGLQVERRQNAGEVRSPDIMSEAKNLGEVLTAVRAWEMGHFEASTIDPTILERSYAEALGWAAETLDSLAV